MIKGLYFEGTVDPKEMNWEVSVTNDLGLGQRLPVRLDLANHSPDGFSWGYNGSGPAQLALAILAYQYDDETAKKYYQFFKERVIARLNKDKGWSMTSDDVIKHMVTIQADYKAMWRGYGEENQE